MAKKKSGQNTTNIEDIIPAPSQPQLITDTIEKNYMPYVMSVIISRAIPEIDGLKPAHRKLLYTMYKMGLLTGPRTKSANVVGATMKLNPHGDSSIYETMVRLTRGNESLLHPLIDSKGSFGKQYSSDMKYAAPRYTEVKLDTFSQTLFEGIDKNSVDMVPNYDNTMEEPVLLPSVFPNVLVMPNKGIAVGLASNICSFNLSEVCDGTIALLRKPSLPLDKLMEIIKAPDFPGGGTIIYEPDEMRKVFESGTGSIRIRSRYKYDKSANCIDIIQIPYSTSIELIMAKITAMVKDKNCSLKDEIADFRDEIDLNGFKLTLDLKRNVDPDKLMLKLFKQTPLEDSFKCNFNILINAVPKQLGVKDILLEWIQFRIGCVKRELEFDLTKKKAKLHLLLGLGKILLDIDKAIRIIRKTEKDEDVIPNLMTGFDIDKEQAENIADIKLRNLNREYILNRIAEIESLQKEIAEIEEILQDEIKQKALIAKQLTEIKQKYGKPRLSQICYAQDLKEYVEDDTPEIFDGTVFVTNEGYIKKISSKFLQKTDEQKLKEGDYITFSFSASNQDKLIIITNLAKMYFMDIQDIKSVKGTDVGEYLPGRLKMDNDEKPIFVKVQNTFNNNENLIFIYENGKGVKIPLSQYEIKGNRRYTTGAYSQNSPLISVFYDTDSNPIELLLYSNDKKAIAIKSSLIPKKNTKTSSGSQLIILKDKQILTEAITEYDSRIKDGKGFKKIKIPALGVPVTLSKK